MKKWASLSFLSAILTSVITITLKKGVETILSADFTAYMSLISLLITSGLNFFSNGGFSLNLWGMSTGIFLAIANIIFIKSSQVAPNPGIALALMRCQAIYTFIASYFIFGGRFKPYKLVGMVLVVAGVYLVVKYEKLNKTTTKQENKNDKDLDQIKGNQTNYWIKLALLSGIFFSIKDIVSKKALDEKGSNGLNIFWNALILQVLTTFAYKYYTTGNLALQNRQQTKTISFQDTNSMCYIFLTGFIFSLYGLTIFDAMEVAPNIGYVKSINTFGVVLSVILSKYFFKVSISPGSWAGIALTMTGLVLVAL